MKALICHTKKNSRVANVLGWRSREGEWSGVEGTEGALGRGFTITRHGQRSWLSCGLLAKPQPDHASHWCCALREEMGLEKAPGPVLPHSHGTEKGSENN